MVRYHIMLSEGGKFVRWFDNGCSYSKEEASVIVPIAERTTGCKATMQEALPCFAVPSTLQAAEAQLVQL